MAIYAPAARPTAPLAAVRGNHIVVIRGEIALEAGDLTLNQVIHMLKVPRTFCVTGLVMVVSDLDTGTDVALSIGDSGNAGRYGAGLTTAQAGGVYTATIGLGTIYAADDTIQVKLTTAPGTAAAGTIKLFAFGFNDDLTV